jgi:hypothetical protein
MHFLRHLSSLPRHVSHFIRGHTHRHRRLRNHLFTLGVVTIAVDALGTYFTWKAEKHALVQPVGGARFGVDANWAHIKDFWDSAFYTTTQLLTVSSLMNNPYTTWGRIIDVGLEAYGITVVAALAGAFGAFFLAGRDEVQDQIEEALGETEPPPTGGTLHPPAPA